MTQYEFIQELETALQGHVSPRVVEYNVNYYREYIREQLAAGKTQEEVFELLGSPRMIAKTIISAEEAKGNAHELYEETEQKENGFKFSLESGKWYHTVLIVLAVIFVVSLLVRVAAALFRILFWPIVIAAIGCVIWECFKKK